ncbi:hypothetical protein [Sedimentimonas flavescens]|uniref:hypothetical protein n=1 Tax=Sedimentimonas flavescens TaxID=2851012 RepID=UPI0021A7F607|nr:hypothetical protein [Sedimentimonas flavescens]MCT2539629.1 hypothetical protein [Sedimentimonas flavescens]WBL33128.1 hypothetical protein O5O51_00015 [Sinirhodobacter sp. HNIBRBA609]
MDFWAIGIIVWLGVVAAPMHAACPTGGDFKVGDKLHLVRADPLMDVVYSKRSGGSIREDRTMVRDGAAQQIQTDYLNGVFAVRRVGTATLALKFPAELATFDPSAVGAKIDVAVALSGAANQSGRLQAEVVRRDRVRIGGCRYKVTVVRDILSLSGTASIRTERLYQPDLGVIVGALILNSDGSPQSRVAFDKIEILK